MTKATTRQVLTAALAGLLLAVALVLGACDGGEKCDPGQRYDHGLCYVASPDGTAASTDAASGEGGPDGGTAGQTAFGATCGDSSECAAPTDWCAMQPGQTEGYCTETGCLDQPDECPDGWACTDLSIYQEGLPAICTRP